MIDVYRRPAPGHARPMRWTLDELVRAGGYYANVLRADRWSSGYQLGRENVCFEGNSYLIRWVNGCRFIPCPFPNDGWWLQSVDDLPEGYRPATLPELLWYGIFEPGFFGCGDRLHSAGSFAWNHWKIDGAWTAGVPYVADIPGRARLHPLTKMRDHLSSAHGTAAFLFTRPIF